MAQTLSSSTRLSPNAAEVAAKIMDGEAILINLSDGMYYSMDLAGGLVWQMIETHASVSEIVQSVSAHYTVEPDQAAADILQLAGELLAARLVLVCSDLSSGERPAPPVLLVERSAYQAPHLNAYRDMAELLALDPPHPGLAHALSKPLPED